MLPKHHRLTRAKDFTRVRRRGRSGGNALLAVYVLPVHLPTVRIGFSVSKKVGKAVVRNRVKRRMREVIRHQIPHMSPGQDIVVVARPPAAQATYCELESALLSVFQKTGAIRRAAEATHA